MMTDNCGTMIRAGKISTMFRKIYCAAHKLAKINDRLHQENVFKKVDLCLTKLNAFLNYRHQRYNLPLKPLTSTSSNRPWRSHLKNYEITLRNYAEYELLKLKLGDNFPNLPDKIMLMKLFEFQKSLCQNFEILESKESDLLDHIRCYV